MFYSESNKPKTIPMPETSKFETTYIEKINPKTGKKELVETGKTNVYEKIQEAINGNEINNLMETYKNINQIATPANDAIIDLTELPENLIEANNMLIDARNEFNAKTTKFKQKFNNSFEQYVAAFKSGKLQKALIEEAKEKMEQVSKPEIQPSQQQERVNYEQN